MRYEMYIGGYGKNSLARAEMEDGRIRVLERYEAANHSYLTIEGDCLYAVSETPNGRAIGYSISEDGTLSRASEAPTGGGDPCHVSVAGRTLLVSNYSSGSLARFALEKDGTIGRALPLIARSGRGAKPERQECAHIHFAQRTPGGWVAVSDLGTDSMLFIPYAEIGNDAPEPIVVHAPAGYGPRHLAFPKKGECWYALCELESELLIYHGSPTRAALIGRMPVGGMKGANYPAAIRLSLDEGMLAATGRGEDIVSLYAIGAGGMLSHLCTESSRGAFPRDVCFTPDGKYLVCANQKGNSLSAFEVRGGRLHYVSQAEFEAPSCVQFRKK